MPNQLNPARRILAQVALAFLLVLLAIWGGITAQLQRAYAEETRLAESGMGFQAQAIAETARSRISRVNELIFDLREEWIEQPDQFAHLVQMRQAYVGELIFQVAVIDRDGYMIYSNLRKNPGRIYLGDREHFRIHRERGGDQLYISDPVIGRVAQRELLQLTRPIYRAGAFDGVLVVSLVPSALLQEEHRLTPLGDLNWRLARADGRVLASELAQQATPRRLSGAPFNLSAPPLVGTAHEGTPDLDEQLVGYALLPDTNLVVVARTPMRGLLTNYARHERQLLLAGSAFSAMLAVAAWLLLRSRTAESQARARAQVTEGILSSAMDVLGEGFAVYDRDDRLVYCNDRYRNLYTLSADAIEPGTRFEDILRFGLARGQYPEAAGRETEWLAERMAQHALPHSDLVQPLRDGRWLRILERITPAGHHVGLRIDITDRVNEHRALEVALGQAEQASQAKSSFLANISHALQTPLASVLGFAELLQRSPLDARQASLLDQLRESSTRLHRLVGRLLDFTALEHGALVLIREPFDPLPLLHDCLARARQGIGDRPLQLQDNLHERLCRRLIGDGPRLAQALDELLDNALRFTSAGHILVTADWQADAHAEAGRLTLTVHDTGIGIAAADQDRIFLPLTQLEDNSDRRHDGTGLGLALAHGIIREMGGSLTVSSAPGQGARFMIEVTLQRAPSFAIEQSA